MPFDYERLIRIPINSVNHELGFQGHYNQVPRFTIVITRACLMQSRDPGI
jgi:hypothetical protein